MSGHKRATISLSNFDLSRLENIEEKLRNVENDYASIRNRIKENQAKELQNNFDSLVSQQNTLTESISTTMVDMENDVQNRISFFEEKMAEDTVNQAQNINADLLEFQNEVWEQSIDLIKDYQYQSEINLTNNLKDFQTAILSLTEELAYDEQQKYELSQRTLFAAETLLTKLIERVPVERYYPGEINKIEIELNQGWGNLENGMVEAGFTIGQQLLIRCRNLYQDIIKKEWTRKTLLSVVVRRVNEIYEIGKQKKAVSALDLDGNELNIEVDVPFWSYGLYNKAIKKTLSYKNQIERNGEKLSSEDLKGLLSVQLVKLEDEINHAIYSARRNVLASQVRFNIAGSVIQALMEQGFNLSSGRYCESDQRSSYQALLRNLDGSEVVIQVSELEGELGLNQIDLETIEASKYTEHELRQRAKEMAISLSKYGLQIGKKLNHKSTPEFYSEDVNGFNQGSNSPTYIKENQVSYGRNLPNR